MGRSEEVIPQNSAKKLWQVISVVCVLTLFIWHSTGGSAAFAKQSNEQYQLTDKALKKLMKQIVKDKNKLFKLSQKVNTLLEKDHLQSSRTVKRTMNSILEVIRRIQRTGFMYFQAPRSNKLTSKRYLKFRKIVSSLFAEPKGFFDRVDGHLCLKPAWARRIAELALKLGDNSLGHEYFMRAYYCHGTQHDLNRAQAIISNK